MGHIPVLLNEMIEALAPKDSEVYVDATFGGGGYTQAILDAAKCQVIAIDRDPDAAKRAKTIQERYKQRFSFYPGSFTDLPHILTQAKHLQISGVVFDFGVSSFQIDEPERGFSFRFNGPLDMRMSGEGLTAADVVNNYSEEELADIIFHYGEERHARRIAKAIVNARVAEPFTTTQQLADLVKSKVKTPPKAQHPATLTFQALRIFVNNELIEIKNGLNFAEKYLAHGGRLVAVTFHSLEDRLVKTFIKDRSLSTKKQSRLLPGEREQLSTQNQKIFVDLYPRGIAPSESEILHNPRSRSARLRAAIKQPLSSEVVA